MDYFFIVATSFYNAPYKEKEEYKEKEREQKENLKISSLSDSLSSRIDYDYIIAMENGARAERTTLSHFEKQNDSSPKTSVRGAFKYC